MKPIELEFADGWEEVAPRKGAPDFLCEIDGQLRMFSSDFTEQHNFGSVGSVDCPLAYDASRRVAYRYTCPDGLIQRDYSRLCAYDLTTGAARVQLELRASQWILWLLEWVEGNSAENGALLGLLASDMSSDASVEIRHQLCLLKAGEAPLRTRPLCRDAFTPLDFCGQRGVVLFAGAEGVYLVNLRGERKERLLHPELGAVRGGALAPCGEPRVALGGAGLRLWDYRLGVMKTLHRAGQFPVWSRTGEQLYFSESSSDLFRYDLSTERVIPLLKVKQCRHPERSHARKVSQSPCGRYLALPVTSKRLRGVSAGPYDHSEREVVYEFLHETIVMDVVSREFWRKQCFASNLCWIEVNGHG